MLLPILLEEVRLIRGNIFCELYVVKFWEGMVCNSLSCHTLPKAWHAPWFFVFLFLLYCSLNIVCLKISHKM